MPNWCNTVLDVSGDRKKLESLVKGIEDKGFFQSIIPLEDYSRDNAIECWGTKWEADIEIMELECNDDGTADLLLDFNSAWDPPINVLKALAEEYQVEAWWVERGQEIAGQIISDGKGSFDVKELQDVLTISDVPEKDLEDLVCGLEDWLKDEEEFQKQYEN